MQKTIIFFFSVLASLGFCPAMAQDDLSEIKKVCNYYIEGGTSGDSLMFSKAFLPEGQMLFMRSDTLRIMSLKDFMARARNGGAKLKRTSRIEDVKIYGNAATAKLTIEYDSFYFHDLMNLLKTESGWKIVNKIFYREEKKSSEKLR